MGLAHRITLYFALCYLTIWSTTTVVASEDVEFKDPHLVEIANFAANSLIKDADLGLNNKSSLHRIMDAQIVPNAQPNPTQYMLTLELGVDCSSEGNCKGGRTICEVNVLDEPWAKKKTIDEEKTRCADREPNAPMEFIDTSSTIATSLSLEDAATKALATKAVSQMGDRRGGKHSLKHIGQVRKVMMEESNSNLYYLTLYISTSNDDSTTEVCEVTMEEALSSKEQTLQSLRCFATEGGDKLGIVRVSPEDLTSGVLRHAVLASLAIIDAESTSQFQLKVIGYSLVDSKVSTDSGTRDLQMKLGLVPTLCIKHPESDDDEEAKSCMIDVERSPAMCSITLTQWPWVTDGNLFSDLECEPTKYAVISEELEAYSDDDGSAGSGEEGAEVEEVTSNAVQPGNRRETVEDVEQADEEDGGEVEEGTFSARSGPCFGCPIQIDADSQEVKDMAVFALSALENAANADKVQSIARVVKATSQIVSGTLYTLTVELADTDCERSQKVERSKCRPDAANGVRRTCSVGILDQPWLNSKQIRDPSCGAAETEVESRSLKSSSGVVSARENMTLSPEDDDVKAAANFALNRLDAFDDNTKKRVLIKVIEAVSHSVARSKTFNLKIQVALVDCPESSSPNDPICEANLGRSIAYLCDIQVLAQAGADRLFVPKRLVDSKCFPAAPADSSDKKDLVGEESGNRQVPGVQQLSPTSGPLGGASPADRDSPYVQSIAQFAATTVNQRSNSPNSLKLIRVVRADTQVVAGKKITLDIELGITNCTKANSAGSDCHVDRTSDSVMCRVTVWDRAWLNDRRVTNMSCDSSLAMSSGSHDPAAGVTGAPHDQSQLVGAPVSQDPMSTEIETYADFALAVIEEQSNGNEKLKVAKILASSIQVVEGKSVRLTLEVAPTRCRRDQDLMQEDCPIDETNGGGIQICNIQIWDRAWLSEKQVTDLNCQPKRSRTTRSEDMDESPFAGDVPANFRLGAEELLPRTLDHEDEEDMRQLPVLGGYSNANVTETDVVEMASYAIAAINVHLNGANSDAEAYQLLKIHSAAKQVVAGLNYKLRLEVTRSDGSVVCNVTVFDQPWTGKRDVSSIDCPLKGSQQVQGRTASGPVVFRPAELSDPEIKKAAEHAVEDLTKSSPDAPFELVRINAAARQNKGDESNFKLTLQLLQSRATVLCDVIVSGRELSSSSCAGPRKRQRQLHGGYSRVHVDDYAVQEMANFATAAISESSNEGDLTLLKVSSASRQVVSGVNYKLGLKLNGPTGTQTCNVVIYDQSWTKTRKLTSFDCKTPTGTRTNRQLPKTKTRRPGSSRPIIRPVVRPNNAELSVEPPPHCQAGGYCPVDPNEKAVKEMSAFATTALSQSQSRNSAPLTLVKVKSAARQVVAGFNYKLELEFNDGSLVCNVVVFDQAWTSTRELSSSECKPAGRGSPSAPGAVAEPTPKPAAPSTVRPVRVGAFRTANPKDATVQAIAQFATSAVAESSNSGPLTLIQVVKASTQVVSGINYKLTMKLSGAGGNQTCEVVVYDQSWTKTRQLSNFDCTPESPPPPSPAAPAAEVPAVSVAAGSDTAEAPPKPEDPVEAPTVEADPIPAMVDEPVSATESEAAADPVAAAAEGIPVVEPVTVSIKPFLTGAYEDADPNSDTIQEMAQFATSSIGQSSNAGPLSLLRVIKAATQVVSGFNHKMTIQLSGADGSMTCEVVVYDPSVTTNTRRVTSFNCVPDSAPSLDGSKLEGGDDEDDDKVSADASGQQPGVFLRADPEDETVRGIALYATSLLRHSMGAEELDLVRVSSAAAKPMGDNTAYQLLLDLSGSEGPVMCDVVIHEGEKTRQMAFSSCAPGSPQQSRRSKRSPVGGVTAMDLQDDKVKQLADLAVTAISLRSNEPTTPNMVRVTKATQQLVSGMSYNLELELGFTDCPQDVESCSRYQKCSVTIWEQPWLQKKDVTKLSCKDSKKNKKAQHRLGGLTRADPESEEIRSHALVALQAIQAQSNSPNRLGIVRVKNAATQIVSGKKIFLTVEVGQCNLSGSNSNNGGCSSFDDQADRQLCKVAIWTRPWLKESQVTDLNCSPMAATTTKAAKPCTGKSCPLRVRRSSSSGDESISTTTATSTQRPRSHHHHHHRKNHNLKKVRRLKHMTAFRNFANKFGKVYTTWEEFERRYKIYRANREKIELLNMHEMGTAVYGDTPFADWSAEEYKQHLAGMRPLLRGARRLPKAEIPDVKIPDEFDWRHYNVVTPVKNQGSCGSCWAFSVTGNIEGLYGVQHGELLSLSEQELVDCDKLDSGCNGGLPENAYKAIQEIGGLESESEYPYNGRQNTCHYNANKTLVQVTGGVELPTDETEMAKWLVQNGPISIGINANAMQFYRGGVSHPWKVLCRPGGIDHGVLIVGYGVSEYPKFNKTLPYWTIKNSWGTSWGEQGYYRVYRGDGTCGVNQMATSAVVA